ncbi:MAG: dihydrofolate reductase family protein [Devosia sp.]
MSKVIYNMSMSLDGFVRASGNTPAQPLGAGGERLHQWFFGGDPANEHLVATMLDSIGAVVSGRTTYDASDWGADGPTGPLRLPTFVVTHKAPSSAPENGVYTFATGGVAQAIHAARDAANGKDVSVMGGPDVGCQAVAAGVVDEIVVSIVPVLFGDGLPMFASLPRHIQLERVSLLDTSDATHITYRIAK